jgi:hypothetical protein
VVLGLRVITDAHYVAARRQERFGLGWNSLALPVDAVRHAESAGLGVRVLNHLNFGGYLIWARDEPVFIDGRLEVVGERFYGEYRRALETPAGFYDAVERYGITWVLFPYQLRPDLLDGLTRDPQWGLIYVDHLAAAFVRVRPGWEALVHESARRAMQEAPVDVDLGDLPGLRGNPRPGTPPLLSGLLRRASYPSEAFGRGVFHFHRGEAAKAARGFADAVAQSGGAYYEIYENLGSALLALRRYAEARECYRLVLAELPLHRSARRRLVLDRLEEIERRR